MEEKEIIIEPVVEIKIEQEPVVNVEAEPVVEDVKPEVLEPVVVKGFKALRNVKIENKTIMKDEMLPKELSEDAVSILLESGYVLPVE